MTGFTVQFEDDEYVYNPDRLNLLSYFYRLGELQVLANRLLQFARGEEILDRSPLTWDEFRNAYGNLNLWIDEYRIDEQMNLEGFTRRRIERGLDSFDA